MLEISKYRSELDGIVDSLKLDKSEILMFALTDMREECVRGASALFLTKDELYVINGTFTVDLDTQGTRIGLPLGEDELTDRVNEIIDKVLEQDLYNQWYEEYKEYAKKLGLEG